MLAAGAVIGALLGFAAARSRPVRYEGVTTLLVIPSTSSLPGTQINLATFRAITENASLASQVIAEFGLSGPPNDFTPQQFLQDAVTIEDVRGTNLVRVKVRLPEPEPAAGASRSLARRAITLTQQITQEEGSAAQSQLRKHLDDASVRLGNAERALLEFQQRAQVDLLKEDTDALLNERGGLLRLTLDIETEKARLSVAEQEIKRQDRVLPSARSVGAEEALRRVQLQAQGRPDPRVDPETLDLTNSLMNPVYQTLDFQIATSRARIAALEQQRRQLIDVRKVGADQLPKLNELYRRQIELARLQTSFDLAKRVHSDLTVRYEATRTQAVGNRAQLQLVDEAIPPDLPVSRRTVPSTVLGFAAGLMLAGLVALAIEGRIGRSQPAP